MSPDIYALPEEPPDERPEGSPHHNPSPSSLRAEGLLRSGQALPLQPTPLIGREQEIEAAGRLLRRPEVRLLTLVGPPGIGKTRLAIGVAAGLFGEFPDGVCFVPLASIGDPDLVMSAVTQALDIREASNRPLLESLKSYLHSKAMLLLLDNFEQVASAAPLLADLLAGCPGVKLLVTSRERLHLYGEHDYPVPPLSLPDPNKLPDLEALSRYEAITLFVQRAQAVSPGFGLTERNAPAVAEICLRLDGLPLAIELAAARIPVLPPDELLARLTNRLKLLTGGARNLPERQRTLRGTIEWSYNLLDPEEQTLFSRLGVFVGGCTLVAIEEVCGNMGLAIDPLDGVTSLVGKSLLRVSEEPTSGTAEGSERQEMISAGPRFTMLETIGEFAREKLLESGQDAAMRRRQADFFAKFVGQVAPELFARSRRQVEWLDRLEQELGNLQAAIEWSLAHGRAETAALIVAPLHRFWFIRGRMSEERRWLEAVLAPPDTLPARVRAQALEAAGGAAGVLGDYERAKELLGEGLSLYRQLGDESGTAGVLNHLGIAANTHGDYELAIVVWEESLALRRALGDKTGVAQCLMNLGRPLSIKGDHAQAQAALEESQALWQELGDEIGFALAVMGLAAVALRGGESGEAETFARQSLVLFRSLGSEAHVVDVLRLLAGAWKEQDKMQQALRLLAAVEAFAEGEAMSLEAAVAYALQTNDSGSLQDLGETEQKSKLPQPPSSAYPDDLTEREVEVLRLIAAGRSNQEIAQDLVLSLRTVERHISNIYQKIGATGKVARATATAYALTRGLTS